jgi:hypothetical protein
MIQAESDSVWPRKDRIQLCDSKLLTIKDRDKDKDKDLERKIATGGKGSKNVMRFDTGRTWNRQVRLMPNVFIARLCDKQ